jgi:hypothetical protein
MPLACHRRSTATAVTAKTLVLSAVLMFCFGTCIAQESPGRFELGANVTALRNPPEGTSANLGFGFQGDVNFGRYFALDSEFDLLPSTSFNGQTLIGLFGAKVGRRTQHFGFFGTVRPGFVRIGDTLRASTIVFGAPGSTTRFDSLTQTALGVGGTLEYYPARHWAMRWNAGDTLIFQNPGPTFTAIFPGNPPLVTRIPGKVTSHFQFSAGFMYRF